MQVGGLGWVACAHRAGTGGRVILNGVKDKIMYEKCVLLLCCHGCNIYS